jgi:hypothetical protein
MRAAEKSQGFSPAPPSAGTRRKIPRTMNMLRRRALLAALITAAGPHPAASPDGRASCGAALLAVGDFVIKC